MMIVVRGSDGHECSSSRTYGVATSVRPIACPDPHFCLNTKECIRHDSLDSDQPATSRAREIIDKRTQVSPHYIVTPRPIRFCHADRFQDDI